MRKTITLLLLLIGGTSFAQESQHTANIHDESPISLNLEHTADVVGNLHGGIKQGVRYHGYVNLALGLSTDKWWRGGELHICASNTHGGQASESLIGDFQIASNIEAGNHTFLAELWYAQNFGRLNLKLGLQDLNTDFAVCDFAGDYINSSFGISSTMATNFSSPLFPITGIGFSASYDFSHSFKLQAALFDGGVIDFEDNPYNLKWRLKASDGLLPITELQYKHIVNDEEKTIIKLGAYIHTTDGIPGVYAVFSQVLGTVKDREFRLFGQFAYSEDKKSDNPIHAGGGLGVYNLFGRNSDDMAGLCATSAFFNNNEIDAETSIEATCKYVVWRSLYIQPDFQYIIHPSGKDSGLANAVVAIFRFGFNWSIF